MIGAVDWRFLCKTAPDFVMRAVELRKRRMSRRHYVNRDDGSVTYCDALGAYELLREPYVALSRELGQSGGRGRPAEVERDALLRGALAALDGLGRIPPVGRRDETESLARALAEALELPDVNPVRRAWGKVPR